MAMFDTVGLYYNPRAALAYPLAEEIAAWLDAREIASWICSTHELPDTEAHFEKTGLLIALGGDGTILRAMPLIASFGIPILGINLGRVGFLTEADPDCWADCLSQIIAGEGAYEERTLLDVVLIREGEVIATDQALNDAVISRGGLGRTIHLRAYINEVPVAYYVADGLILATATGSTAYAYAVGGPILPPWLDNLLLVPVAPHLSVDRPMVLDPNAVVEVHVLETRVPGMLTVDGRPEGELFDDDRIRITRSQLKAHFLRLRSPDDFYRTLVKRLIPHNGDLT
ncbi:MAG TPA: NAD(+)/NADH kinase [Chloroflexi bacterium]|nr:NAD(+)/NADH kinase [Chloroflexota bacterium]